VLVVNAGSSSLKLRLLDDDDVVHATDLPLERGQIDAGAVRETLAEMPVPDAVGHRIVHGGDRFRAAVRIDPQVEAALRDLTDLAPLHQPKSLAALDAIHAELGEVPAVACFDTAFHASLPPAAATYALPAAWRERFGLRRFGFHGISHAYVSKRAAEMLDRGDLRLVSCHLGAGASLAAVHAGRSIDTTMGFTPLEGLVMATRSGSVDPGLLLWLLERETMSEREMAVALENEAGLMGLAGTSDMRIVVERADARDSDAQLALDVYIHRLRGAIAAMAAALGGLDALAFTGGVGENTSAVRELACEPLAFLDVELDRERNRSATGDAEISPRGGLVAVLVIESREDVQIAAEVRRVLGDIAS